MQLKTDPQALTLEISQADAKTLAKLIIQHAEDARHSALLDFAYLLNEAKYDARNDFRQPPHPWEPGTPHPSAS